MKFQNKGAVPVQIAPLSFSQPRKKISVYWDTVCVRVCVRVCVATTTSWHMYEWVMSHIEMSHVTHPNNVRHVQTRNWGTLSRYLRLWTIHKELIQNKIK